MRDVVVLGGGPAGSICAARLASRGRDVLVVERARHPRFHLGESLLPASLDVFEAVGVLDALRARFLVKRGARFTAAGTPGRSRRYTFADAFHANRDHAFQVPRDELDELLFRHAQSLGAGGREGWRAERLVLEGDRATGVVVTRPDGASEVIPARFVVDATGRDALFARARGDLTRVPGLGSAALYTQVRGAWRDEGEGGGDIQVVLGRVPERSWLWLIPFADGRTSVGAVVPRTWLESRRGESPARLLDEAIAGAPAAAEMLRAAERLLEPAATSDFSFRTSRWSGPGWVAVGDAGGFIDPLFSTGVHLAVHGALGAADAIDRALDGRDPGFEVWERELRAGADLFLGAVQAFYAGDLDAYLFEDEPHPFLRRAITSLLSGAVFDASSRWVGEMRSRFPPRA